MKVSNVGSAKSVSGTKKKKKADGSSGDFADELERTSGSGETHGVVEAGTVRGAESILALQASGDATEERRRKRRQAVQYGYDLLDRLDEIRVVLLAGSIPKDRLAELARQMRAQRRRIDDPHLNEIIDEIELRAEVEIAKLTREV